MSYDHMNLEVCGFKTSKKALVRLYNRFLNLMFIYVIENFGNILLCTLKVNTLLSSEFTYRNIKSEILESEHR